MTVRRTVGSLSAVPFSRGLGLCYPNPNSSSEAGGDPGELPIRLGDAASVGHHAATGAATVAVHRPERQPAKALALGPGGDVLPGRRAGQLLLVRQAVHARDALVGVGLGVGPAEGGLQLGLEALGSADRVVVNV